MSTTVPATGGGAGGGLDRSSATIADVVDTILDKGLVIDAYVSVALIGIEILTINARIVVASVDTYLRFAQAANRLDLGEQQGAGLPELVDDITEGTAKGKTKGMAQGALEAAAEKLKDFVGELAEESERAPRRRR
jgi:hypothetical protein